MSKSGSYEDFGVSSPVVDSDACTYTISADEVNAIRWLISQKKLLIGTVGGEWWLSGGSDSDIVTPDAVLVRRETVHGSAALQPIVIGNVVMFLQRDSKKLREFVYSLEADGYQAPDLTVLAEHLTRNNTIIDWGFQQAPNAIVWMVRDDGILVAVTYQRDHNIVGFSRHVTDGEIKSVATIPGDAEDEVWAVVTRYAKTGTTMVQKRFIERMDPEFSPCTDDGAHATRDAFFVDSGLTHDEPVDVSGITAANPVVVTAASHGLTTGDMVVISGVEGHEIDGTAYGMADEINGNKYSVTVSDANTFSLSDPLTGEAINGTAWPTYTSGGQVRKLKTSFTGMAHLAGREVAILADGAPRDNVLVGDDGTFTLAEPAAIVHAGLPYSTNIQTLRIEGGVRVGTAQGKIKRIMSVTLRIHETLGFACGPDAETLHWVDFREAGDQADAPPALVSGDKKVTFPGGYDGEGQVYIRQSFPLPLTLLAVIPEGVVYGD